LVDCGALGGIPPAPHLEEEEIEMSSEGNMSGKETCNNPGLDSTEGQKFNLGGQIDVCGRAEQQVMPFKFQDVC
jgi:hypothetical protein